MDVVLPKPGGYVLAVSGGVDSVSLLHILQAKPGLKLTVAHFDHGIRADSGRDRQFVESLAKQYDLPFVYDEGQLGPGASEATARTARYKFLHKVQEAGESQAIITAHHQDDVLETAIINLLRGTGRKGLTALSNRPGVVRPLLEVPKAALLAYAKDQGLAWREDSTNQNTDYLRNYVRHRLLANFDDSDRAKLLDIVRQSIATNQVVDELLDRLINQQPDSGQIDRLWFSQLPHAVAREVLAAWLRAQGMRGFERQTLERLVVAAKTAAPGKSFPIKDGLSMHVQADRLALVGLER